MTDWREQDDLPPLLQKLLKVMERAKDYEVSPRKKPKRSVLPFHIQHNTTPVVVKTIVTKLDAAIEETPFSPGTWSKIKPFLHQLDILTTNGTLTPLGERLRRLVAQEPELLGEAMHGHLYTLYRFNSAVRFSFAYATICDWLWERRQGIVTGRVMAELVSIVVERGSAVYGIPPEEIAFSPNSVRGAFHWLKSLHPPVLERNPASKAWLFHRRRQCPPLAVLWALSTWWQLNNVPVGEWVTWHEALEDFLSRCLMLDDGYAKIAVEVTAGWQRWRGKVLEVQMQGQFLTALRLNRLVSWGSSWIEGNLESGSPELP
ncbi:MAG: hypothetical protein ACK40X_05170 [Armatimonadota bacterium]